MEVLTSIVSRRYIKLKYIKEYKIAVNVHVSVVSVISPPIKANTFMSIFPMLTSQNIHCATLFHYPDMGIHTALALMPYGC